jgi:predicted glutamine amidotransferase
VLGTNKDEPLRVVVDSFPCPMSEERWRKPNEEENLKVYTRRQPMGEERWRKPNEEENLKVYTLRSSQHEHQQQLAPTTGDTECRGSNMLQQVLKLLNCLTVRHTHTNSI